MARESFAWKPRTLRDERYELLAAMLPNVPPELPAPEQSVRCVCGRMEWPGMMTDVRGLPVETRCVTIRKGGPAAVPAYLCGGCIETLHRERHTDRVALAMVQGAPPEWCARWLAKRRLIPVSTGVPEQASDEVEALTAGLMVEVSHEVALLEDAVRFPPLA